MSCLLKKKSIHVMYEHNISLKRVKINIHFPVPPIYTHPPRWHLLLLFIYFINTRKNNTASAFPFSLSPRITKPTPTTTTPPPFSCLCCPHPPRLQPSLIFSSVGGKYDGGLPGEETNLREL